MSIKDELAKVYAKLDSDAMKQKYVTKRCNHCGAENLIEMPFCFNCHGKFTSVFTNL